MKGISGVPIAPLNGAPHALELSTWLTASLPDTNRRNIVNIAISADQIAANYIGAFTALPSLELATMPQTHKENQEGLNEAYYSHCSYGVADPAPPAETDPRSVFKRLFQMRDAGKPGVTIDADALDRSMLDLVLGGAKDLRGKLSRGDQHKLDEYLDGIRSLERRIAADGAPSHRGRQGSGGDRPVQAQPDGLRPDRGQHPRRRQAQRIHAGDVRPDGAGVPDRPHAREHLHRVDAQRRVLSGARVHDEHHSQTHHNNKP